MSRSLITCELVEMNYDRFIMDLEIFRTFGWICNGLENILNLKCVGLGTFEFVNVVIYVWIYDAMNLIIYIYIYIYIYIVLCCAVNLSLHKDG